MVGGKRGSVARNWMQLPQVPLRAGVGGALLYHSAPMVFTAAGHANFAYMLGEVGLPFPDLSAWGVALLELAGSLALIAGAFVVFTSAVVSLEILVRISTIYLLGRGFPAPMPGQSPLPDYELNLMYIAGMVALIIGGSGYFSYDWARLHPPVPAGTAPRVRRDPTGKKKTVRKEREGMNV